MGRGEGDYDRKFLGLFVEEHQINWRQFRYKLLCGHWRLVKEAKPSSVRGMCSYVAREEGRCGSRLPVSTVSRKSVMMKLRVSISKYFPGGGGGGPRTLVPSPFFLDQRLLLMKGSLPKKKTAANETMKKGDGIALISLYIYLQYTGIVILRKLDHC